MSIFKESFKPGVKNQITKRQEGIFNRTPSSLQYFNARNAWIRMSSAVNVGGTNSLARDYILLGGVLLNGKLRSGVGRDGAYSTLTPAKNADHRLGIRPMPGITGIDVKSKSAYGSLREVVVKFNAWDIKQLEDLELLYMRPGYTVLVEWGWVPYLDNSGNLQTNISFVDGVINGGTTKEKIWSETFTKSAENGNYDALYGFVKNYGWSARPDGGYDCSVTVISIGEILESLKVNYAAAETSATTSGLFGQLDASYFEKGDSCSKSYSQNVIAGICNELYLIVTEKLKPDNYKEATFSGWTFYRFDVDIEGSTNDTADNDFDNSTQIYITLKDFVDVLNKHITLQDSENNTTLVKVSVNEGAHMGGEDKDLLCLGHVLQLSVDPSICLIKNEAWLSPSSLGFDEGFFDDFDTLKSTISGMSKSYWYNGDYTDTQFGVIGNIYVNLGYLYSLSVSNEAESQDKKEKNDIALFDYLKNMMTGINTAIGNLATFDIFSDPVDSAARIIDVNFTDPRDRQAIYDDAFIIELQNTKSVVRSYKLESQIFPEQSSIIAIGAQAEGGALGSDTNTLVDFNQGLIDRIIPKKKVNNKASGNSTPDSDNEIAKNLKTNMATIVDYINAIDAPWWTFGLGTGDYDVDNSSKYANSLKDLIAYYRSRYQNDTSNRAIIPTKLSLTMDGIGGIIIGNLFRINDELLPRGYKGDGAGPSKIAYLVTGLNHSVQNNDWTTTVDAQFILLDEPKSKQGITDIKDIAIINRKAASGDGSGVKNKTEEATKRSKDNNPPPGTPPGPPSKDLPPGLTVDKVIKAMQNKGYNLFANTAYGKNKLNIVGIKNTDKKIDGRVTNYFSDIVVMFYYDDAGQRQERIGRFTTVPGLYFQAKEFGNDDGLTPKSKLRTISIKEGQYKEAYYQGNHKSQAKAMRQSSGLPYMQDKSLNSIYNNNGSESNNNYTNIHNSGNYGSNDPKKLIDNWSAGCQVFRSKDDFDWMGRAADNQISKTKVKKFDYTLLNIKDIPGFENTTDPV